MNINSALNDMNVSLPYYRFQVILQKAMELCADIKSLGAALLSALEKKDAEELTLLHTSQEVNLLNMVHQIKQQQVKEAKEALGVLKRSKDITEKRKQYYKSRKYMNAQEKLHLNKLESAHNWQSIGQGIEIASAVSNLLPDLDIGVSGWASTPVVKTRFGGINIGAALQASSRAMSLLASMDQHDANMASIKGSYDRRQDNWDFQVELATKKIEQIKKQILVAQIRLSITEHELESHDLQTINAKEVEAFMRDKFTNKELYNWMVSQISTLYFQSYQMASDLSKRAEKAFQHDLGLSDSNFIQFGYWDSLRKGLLSGEKLHYDLRRMEIAYLDQNKREYEITKHISLALLNPAALIMLKETSKCFIDLPEVLFDLDYPGHYMRRIKTVSLTIPCVTGPYASVNCTLTLLNNRIRKESNPSSDYVYQGLEDNRFQHNLGVVQSIATSNAQSDSGLFQLNFHEERYLPFEGAGVISSWRLELSEEYRQFDYNTITDVIFHVNYTAREGMINFKSQVKDYMQEGLNKLLNEVGESDTGLFRLFSFKHEFSNEFHRFLSLDSGSQETTIKITKKHFPYLLHNKDLVNKGVKLILKPKDGFNMNTDILVLSINERNGSPWNEDLELGGLQASSFIVQGTPEIDWNITIAEGSLDSDEIEDILLLINYGI